MTDPEELLDLALMLEKKAKLATAKAALHRHHGREDDAAKETANADYCRGKADVCRRASTPKRKREASAVREPSTPTELRLAKLFSRRPATKWSEGECKMTKRIGTIEEDDFAMLERYYAAERAKGEEGRHRRDLATFLNNFTGELDRARAVVPKTTAGTPGTRGNPYL